MKTRVFGVLGCMVIIGLMASQAFANGHNAIAETGNWNDTSTWADIAGPPYQGNGRLNGSKDNVGDVPTGAEGSNERIEGKTININNDNPAYPSNAVQNTDTDPLPPFVDAGNIDAYIRNMVVYNGTLNVNADASLRLTNSLLLCNNGLPGPACSSTMNVNGGSIDALHGGGATSLSIGVGGGQGSPAPHGQGGDGTLNVTNGGSVVVSHLSIALHGSSQGVVNILDGAVSLTGNKNSSLLLFNSTGADNNSGVVQIGDDGILNLAGDQTALVNSLIASNQLVLAPGSTAANLTVSFDPNTTLPYLNSGGNTAQGVTTVTPEPASMLMFLVGVAMVALSWRRRLNRIN